MNEMGRKWNNIKEKKAQKDKNTSRIYAKFGREIYVAAKKGEPDPESNQALKAVLDRAKTYSVPKHIIDKAIDKAKGNVEETFDELRYEGFGPAGSMIIVDALTNNVNRTASDVRATFGKNGGNMGQSGSVSYLFDDLCVFGIKGFTEDEVFEWMLDAEVDVEEIELQDDTLIITAPFEQFHSVRDTLEHNGVESFEVAERNLAAQSELTLSEDDMDMFEQLIDALEELEDVQNVYHNVDE